VAFLCIIFATQGIAFCQQSQELTVIGPADNVLGGLIKEISQSFSDANNIAVNITQIKGREMAAKEVSKNKSNADIVILEKEYQLFNLSGMKRLEEKKLIDNCTYLYSENALLIFRAGEAIGSLGDLDGMIVAVTDQHVPGACLAKKIVDKEHLNVSEVNESSNEAQLDAVAAGRANATVLWESMFESYANSTNTEIKAIDLTDYRMDNYIAILKKSNNPAEAEMYVKYLLAALASGSSGKKIPSAEA
jgi:ABC-type molybdate transport system substrate-binding protein